MTVLRAAVAAVLVLSCEARTAGTRTSPQASELTTSSTLAAVEASSLGAECVVPSLGLGGVDDVRGLTESGPCGVEIWDTEQPVAHRCGQGAVTKPLQLGRLLAGVLPLDEATTSHVRKIFEHGKGRGRRADVVGLVGDSITVDVGFMGPFSARAARGRAVLTPEVREALTLEGTTTIIEWFQAPVDSFCCVYRAARVGADVGWVLGTRAGARERPLDVLIESFGPAFAVVLLGTNDALGLGDAQGIVKQFRANLGVLLATLEGRGVIPILTTLPKHLRDRRMPDCGAQSNGRAVVMTNAVSAAVAEIACERHLPLIDLRYALEVLWAHGVGPDGVHPTVYELGGGGTLNEVGLQCGMNVRNLVTLRMLKVVRDVVMR
ncbi:MAG: SGNH/GDSL hydrolase family protein [Myxococcales bacterium]